MPKLKYDHPVIQKGAVQVFAHLAQKRMSSELCKVSLAFFSEALLLVSLLLLMLVLVLLVLVLLILVALVLMAAIVAVLCYAPEIASDSAYCPPDK